MKFLGVANVDWSETESRTISDGQSENHSVSYSGREEYLKTKMFLVGEKGKNVEIIYFIIIILYFCNNFTFFTLNGEPERTSFR